MFIIVLSPIMLEPIYYQ